MRPWEPFLCLYCGRADEEVEPSLAHIFPDALGGISARSDIACRGCNALTNREFENQASRRLDYYRSVWGVPGRRGTPTVRAKASLGEWESTVRLDEFGEQATAAVQKVEKGNPGPSYLVWGPDHVLEAKKAEIERRAPSIRWREGEIAEIRYRVEVDNDPGRAVFRRLATKVAIERLAGLRGPEFARGAEFAAAREFVFSGKEVHPVCAPVYDPLWMGPDGDLNFPLPLHAVALVGRRDDRALIAFVSLFGLYHYCVVLSDRYHALGDWDDLLEEHPLARVVRTPSLRMRAGSIALPWRRWIREWVSDPERVRRAVLHHAATKHDAAADAEERSTGL